MLTRLKFRQNFRLYARYLSDSPSDGSEKPPASKTEPKAADETPKPNKKSTSESTEKIQALLKSMMTAKPVISDEEYRSKFTVAQERKRKVKPEEEAEKNEKIEEKIVKAAGDVAQAIGGDTKQTEAELLSRVLGKIDHTSTSLSDLIIGMKVDRSRDSDDTIKRETRGQQVKRMVDKSKSQQKEQTATRFVQRKQQAQERAVKRTPQQISTVNVFSGEPLGIFRPSPEDPVNYGTKLNIWEQLTQRELALATAQPPANYFQKMIQWTEQGKVWKFPIDNEQGLEEEQKIDFSEHVFLDQHLEGWCPKKGPIRHFMELVCVGLSKNAFYTIQEKREHIMWYKEYFESKKDVLTEIGAWDVQQSQKSNPEASA